MNRHIGDAVDDALEIGKDVFGLFEGNTNYDALAAADGFNAACYIARYPDVKANWHTDPAEHWIRHGKSEGRIPGCNPPVPGMTTTNQSTPITTTGLLGGGNNTIVLLAVAAIAVYFLTQKKK